MLTLKRERVVECVTLLQHSARGGTSKFWACGSQQRDLGSGFGLFEHGNYGKRVMSEAARKY